MKVNNKNTPACSLALRVSIAWNHVRSITGGCHQLWAVCATPSQASQPFIFKEKRETPHLFLHFDTTYGTSSSPEGLVGASGADHSWEGQEGTCAHTAGAGAIMYLALLTWARYMTVSREDAIN